MKNQLDNNSGKTALDHKGWESRRSHILMLVAGLADTLPLRILERNGNDRSQLKRQVRSGRPRSRHMFAARRVHISRPLSSLS